MLRQCSTAFSVLKKSKWFCSMLLGFRPPLTVRGIKLKAEINWIIPNIMTNTATESVFKEHIVFHQSPQFFDEKDDEREWDLSIISLPDDHLYLGSGEKKYTVYLFVNLQQPTSIFAATYFVVVSDEKDQPRQIISEKNDHSPRFLDSGANDIASGFIIGSLEEVNKLSKVSVRCIIEYEPFDLKNSVMIPSKQAESPIIDLDQHSTGWIQQDLEKLFKYQLKSDICFIIDGHELRAHKVILLARSPVFAAMIDKAEVEGDLKSVEIKNISFTTFKDLMHFIYTDQVFLTERNANSLLAAAQQYSIPLLIKKCEQFLQSE